MKKIIVIFLSIVLLCSCSNIGKNGDEKVPDVFIKIESSGDSKTISKFGYEWKNGDTETIACGVSPLEYEDIVTIEVSSDERITFVFDKSMTSYKIERYQVERDRFENESEEKPVAESVDIKNDSFDFTDIGNCYVYVLNVNYENGKSEYAFEIDSDECFSDMYKIVYGAESGNLVLAKDGLGDVMTLNANNSAVYLDGKRADTADLKDGMTVEIRHRGDILETYPARFGKVYSIYAYSLGTENEPGGKYFDLCGLYLKVLEDIWNSDTGLNSGAEIVSIDLSEAPGELTDGEISAIGWIFENKVGAEVIFKTADELVSEGYLTKIEDGNNLYQWDDGVLITITSSGEEDLPNEIKFNVTKWRSPLGAYFFNDCIAEWSSKGVWTDYTLGFAAIS